MSLNLDDIEMVELPNCKQWGFRFKKEDVVIKVNKVGFKEHEDNTCTMNVMYDTIEGELKSDEEQFKQMVGDLVIGLIEEKIWYDEKRKQFSQVIDKYNNNIENNNNNG